MQAMLDAAAPMLKTGVKMLSETIKGDVREGDIGTELGEIARAHPNVSIGSYPFFDDKTGPNTNLVIRARDAGLIAAARADVEAMLKRVRAANAA
jgi:molybdopterin-biosynthesis enzyme MoeA-like protein